MTNLGMRDFSGGWNQRDAPSELSPNESPDMMNFTLDERGGAAKRLGYVKYNATPFGSVPANNLWVWQTGNHVFTQAGTKVYRDDVASAVLTFSTNARCGFGDFAGKVYATHPIDGLYVSNDGSSWSAVTGSPKGSVIVPWQNRLLSLGDPANPPRLSACKAGDATDWTTGTGAGWTNDMRELDSSLLIAAEGGQGTDIQGRPGLLIFKRTSTHRVYDPDNGAYETVDPVMGAASSIAVVSELGRTFVINANGLFYTDGIGRMKEASPKIQPLFVKDQINMGLPDLFCAGRKDDRLVFSLPRANSSANDLELEYHPAQGWIVPHSCAASCYAVYESGTRKLLAGSPTVNGQVYERDRSGADDGQLITCRIQTKWFEPAGGYKVNFRWVRVFGRGAFQLYTKFDFDTGDGVAQQLVLPGGAGVWDQSLWDDDLSLWGPVNYEDHTDFWSLGEGIAISFEARESSRQVALAPPLLDVGNAPEVGQCALYGLQLQSILMGT